MSEFSTKPTNETLDPQDWDATTALGQQMVAEMLAYLANIRDEKVWKPIPDAVKEKFREPAPLDSQSPEDVYNDFREWVMPYPMGNAHPRFWGWVIGSGTVAGALAEMLAAALNPNTGGGEHVANYVEAQVIDWCKEMLGYPTTASGLLVSGCSMANLVGLTVARNIAVNYDMRRDGLQGNRPILTAYASFETHSSIQKAMELLGLGSVALRKIPVNSQLQIDLEALEMTIASDKQRGFVPMCVIGNAGTVNTGAIDDLAGLANICDREKIWFHVDGAFGALAALVPSQSPRLNGMERADSVAFDLHKWMYLPYEIGCILVRNRDLHREAFTLTPTYLAHNDRGPSGGESWFSDFGIQLSRGFKALKAWMSMKEYGLRKYARLIQQNIDQAGYLTSKIEAHPNLEMMAPQSLNIVCFRFVKSGYSEQQLDEFNKEILLRLQEQGIAVPSGTEIDDRYVIRAAMCNHRTRIEDLDILIDSIEGLAEELQNDKFAEVPVA